MRVAALVGVAVATKIDDRLATWSAGPRGSGFARDRDPVEIVLGAGGRYVIVGHRRIELAKRRAPRLILWRLAEQARSRDPRPLGVGALFEAGWPGEAIADASKVKRVHTAIWTLRKLGLGSVLETAGRGYRLTVPVRFV